MGDLRNSRARLKTLLKSVQYPHLHTISLESASVQDLLRILHFALLDYSRAVAAFIQSKGYDLYGKTDARFVDSAFRLLRDEFKYFPSLNSTQFLSQHFWERKLNLVSDILQLVLAKHDESVWLKRQQDAVWSKPKESKGAPTRIENHILPPPSQEKAPSHALTVLQLLRQNQSKSRMQRSKEAEAADTNRKIRAENASSPERLSSERRQAEARSAGASSQQRPSSEQNDVTHARKKQVAFGSFDNNDQQDDRTFNRSSTSHESAIENGAGQRADTQATTHHTEQGACPSATNNADLAETLAALSNQIAGLSSAFMTKISSIEERLGCLESRMHTLSALSDQTQDRFHHPHQTKRTSSPCADGTDAGDNKEHEIENQRASSADGSYSSSNGHHVQSEAASRLRFQIESCSWPPKPSVFARP